MWHSKEFDSSPEVTGSHVSILYEALKECGLALSSSQYLHNIYWNLVFLEPGFLQSFGRRPDLVPWVLG